MGRYAKVAETKAQGGREKFFNGNNTFLLEVQELYSFAGNESEFWKATFKIHETSDPVNYPVGSVGCQLVNWALKYDKAMSIQKALVSALINQDVDLLSPEEQVQAMESICADIGDEDRDRAGGLLVRLNTTESTSQKGNPLTIHNYSSVDADTYRALADEIAVEADDVIEQFFSDAE